MMSSDLRETLLAGTADLPPSRRIDLPRAVREGTRVRRRRQALTTVVALVAVAGLALAGPAVLRGSLSGGHRSAPASPTQPALSYGPLVVDFSAGWLPGHLADAAVDRSTASGDGLVGIEFIDDRSWVKDADVKITVFDPSVRTDFAAKELARQASDDSTPGPTIKGSPSTWTHLPAGFSGVLTWRLSAKAWVVIDVEASDSSYLVDLPETTAQRIAENLRFGVREPVLFPFSVLAPEGTLREVGTLQLGQGSDMLGILEFGDNSMPISSDHTIMSTEAPDLGRSPGISVYLSPAGSEKVCPSDGALARTTTPGGQEAFVHFTATDGCVILSPVHGEEVRIMIVGSSMVRAMPLDAALAFADTVQVVPRPKDRTSWVKPVR